MWKYLNGGIVIRRYLGCTRLWFAYCWVQWCWSSVWYNLRRVRRLPIIDSLCSLRVLFYFFWVSHFFPLLTLWNYTKKMLNSCQNDSFLLDEWERRMDQENIPFFVSVWFRIKSKKRNKSLRGYREQCNSII